MLGLQSLEVAIGMIFIFILVSTICSTLREGLESWFKTRAAFLEYGIRQLLLGNEKDDHEDIHALVKSVYSHPLISSLFTGEYAPGKNRKRPPHLASGKNLPSYIPSKNFALVLMDIAARGKPTDAVSSDPCAPVISLESIRANIANIGNPKVQRAMLTAMDTAQGDLNTAQKNIEKWFDSAMDRVSGWYRRSTQWILFWIGLFVAVALNINTISLVDYLEKNDAARSVLVARAEQAAKDTSYINLPYERARASLDSLQLPIGWSQGWGAFHHPDPSGDIGVWNKLFAPILGWLVTALAVTLGAPFWFDLLNKIMVIRSTVKPHEKSPEEGSEDRQSRSQPQPAPAVIQALAVNTPLVPSTPAPPAITTGIPNIRDKDSAVDGCGTYSGTDTKDDELPPAEGGVV